MRTPVKLSAYAAGLVAVFGGALGLGSLVGPTGAAPAQHRSAHAETGTHSDRPGAAAEMPGGLQVAQDGYRLTPATTSLSVGVPRPFRFRVLGADGDPVTAYTPSHDKDLHLIVVRRDLSGYQHLHPVLGADGTWSVPLSVPAPGQYRVFADFRPAGRADALTLGVDVPAPGDYRPTPLPAVNRTATVDGYTVTLAGDLTPGSSSRLSATVTRNGTPVTDLQPYLGAYGHLVALREGDLAYLHVHPDGAPGDGRTTAGPQITFHAEVPTAGTYRLYLDFQHAGRVRTAEFTAVGAPAPSPSATTTAPAATTTAPAGHGDDGHTHDE